MGHASDDVAGVVLEEVGETQQPYMCDVPTVNKGLGSAPLLPSLSLQQPPRHHQHLPCSAALCLCRSCLLGIAAAVSSRQQEA